MLWLAAPLTGLVVQPIIGNMSDRTWGRVGRRHPSVLVTYLGLHDEPRFMNETGATVAGLKLAFTCLMTAPAPQLIRGVGRHR